MQVSFTVLQRGLISRGPDSIAQVLLQLSDSPPEHAMWEDFDALSQAFPCVPVWGQAGFKETGDCQQCFLQHAIVGNLGSMNRKEGEGRPPAHGRAR